MQLIPAIDLMNGKIVRLTRGEAKTAKFYYEEFGTPVDAAMRWRGEGAEKLHIIDLDAAFGNGNNYQVIAEIARTVNGRIGDNKVMPIQVGGGIRNFDIAEKLFNIGVSQFILGTLAFNNQVEVLRIQRFLGPESVIVSLDHENGLVKSSHGWTKSGRLDIDTDANAKLRKTKKQITLVKKNTVRDALGYFTELGVHRFLITSITRDGMLSGPDLETLSEAAKVQNVKIIAAGGIGSINDLVALKNIGVEGAVIGKALYEHRFTLKEAIDELGV
jgi:phosphoribosylformimino-5-aminoimidazole carboxamide ribotide isomerase